MSRHNDGTLRHIPEDVPLLMGRISKIEKSCSVSIILMAVLTVSECPLQPNAKAITRLQRLSGIALESTISGLNAPD
ncbi:MAG: hypothetical protein II336_03865 [Loktanella sp.]|nr:hypothetical protein [Loktanella sp.]